MSSNRDSWIRIFDIPDTSKHKNGFTIYKVISMLYPESCPDAVTKLTVWKRFNDFKKLHREIKVLHRKLNIKDRYPSLPSTTLFKRFDDETIKQRKVGIINFLEFVGNNYQLFTSTVFVKFFETSHTPVDQLSGNINLIRSDLSLPEDPEVSLSISTTSDDDRTISDSDSITTMSGLSITFQVSDGTSESLPHRKLKRLGSTTSVDSFSSKLSESCTIGTFDSLTLLDGQIFPTPPDTPALNAFTDDIQYIVDASLHINLATELEKDKKYEEAFAAYKTAIDILLKYVKDDSNYDRKQMVRYKTEKYLIKAEKIYNMYLAPEVKYLRLDMDESSVQSQDTKGPLFDLYKFKVVRVVDSGMLVLHSELQQIFYIKVVHKTTQFLNENLILPESVPYMVKLQNHYNCDHALFLVLEYCSGTKLRDYMKSQMADDVFTSKEDHIMKQIQETSDNESEQSFSELIKDYTNNRKSSEKDCVSSDDSFEKVDVQDLYPNKKSAKNIMDEPVKNEKTTHVLSPFGDISHSSCYTKETSGKEVKEPHSRKFSELSCCECDEQFDKYLLLPEDTVVRWAAQLLLALEKLHTLGVICRDLQTKNILINDNGDLTLTYMCNIKDLCDLYSNGVNVNLAPEVYSFHQVTKAVDWWSFGAILYEFLVGMPLSDIHPNGISSYTHLKIPKYVSPEGRSILRQLLTYEPHNRLGSGVNGTENIKSHPYFASVKWDILVSKYK